MSPLFQARTRGLTGKHILPNQPIVFFTVGVGRSSNV